MAKKITPRFPEYEWYCVDCQERLNDQTDFNDNKFKWKCTNCGYSNSISKDNLRKPYAYLTDKSTATKIISFFVGIIRAVYGLLFRIAFYCLVTYIVAIRMHLTTIDHLKLGTINPRGIDDYFCCALYYSGIIVIVMLVVFALCKIIFGRPDIKKHFIRETYFFFRDSLLYPLKVLKSIFKKTTIIDKILSIADLLILILSFMVLYYGCSNWL